MTSSVIGLYDDPDKARQVINQLTQAGIGQDAVELIDEDEQDLEIHIGELGVSRNEVRLYAEAVRHGRVVLSAETPDDQAEQILDILNRNGALDVDEVAQQLQQEGQEQGGSQEAIRQVEEKLTVGKKRVLQGGKRITTKVSEQPVEERVTLREETVEIEQKPSERRLSPEEAESAFKEETREFTETREVPEVKKEARETGRVEVTKRAEEREETVRDTVRKSEIRTEEIKPEDKQ